ncbi:peroxide-responsive transcriptional repressor PerR [Streptococcus pantholopis]|uniref:Transcriptional repressor n=1 Tax=Streptococcus pantholopis TaxID=1811193 RepID=A0A172Q951_9STRE|nr:peroxide-responsive transcriptional repressor PerR [Streptococcus pantholopis]AND79971.1 transcriptional repressor [Streptococcus pantholopis]
MDFHSHNHQALDAYENVLAHLKEKHIRITQTRKAVIAYMVNSQDHPSADTVYHDLLPDYPNLSLATVYNNLKLLVDEGFVSELKLSQDSTAHYDFMGHQHLNIVCDSCGKITDFMDVDVLKIHQEVHEQTGYQVTQAQLILYGICPDCQARKKKEQSEQ